jgi:Xaa-Pro aminopeptidase
MTNIEKIRAELPRADLDALLLLSPVNRRYATKFASSDGVVLITKTAAHFITDSRYIEAARRQTLGADVHEANTPAASTELLRGFLRSENVRRLGFEGDRVTYSELETYTRLFDEQEFIAANSVMQELRAVKTEEELTKLRAAQALTDAAFEEICGFIKPGVTEKRIAAELIYRMMLLGAENISFDPIVASGPNSSMPHAVPGDRRIQRGDFVTLDFGCILDGYCSDMTRTVAVGGVAPEMERVYYTVLDAQQAGIAAAKAGVPGREVHQAAATVIAAAGYGEYFSHGFGHGVGLEIHELPRASLSWNKPLPAGSVISAEPGIYLPERFGVRIEDLLIIGSDTSENITSSPKSLLVL